MRSSLMAVLVATLVFLPLLNANAQVFWLGSPTTEIEGDDWFHKLSDHIDDYGMRVRVFLRKNSDYIYTFYFDSDEKVIAAKIQVLDKGKIEATKINPDELSVKQITYAKFLEIQTTIRDNLRHASEKRGHKEENLSISSERDYQWVDFEVGQERLLSLGIFDEHLSIITPKYTKLYSAGFSKKIRADLEKMQTPNGNEE